MALSIILLSAMLAQGQEKESYWTGYNVTRVDHQPIWGITLSYMEMLADMRIHLSKQQDVLTFAYPEEKSVKISELKSLTNCRMESTGELLDSVYEIGMETDTLRIKFHYNGRDGENRFSLNLVKIDKSEYFEEVEKRRTERKQLLDSIQAVDLSALNLSIPVPGYFTSKTDLGILNPIGLAEDLCNMKTLQIGSSDFECEAEGKDRQQYNNYDIQNAEYIDKVAATLGGKDFHNLSIVKNINSSEIEALVVSGQNFDKETIRELFDFINAKQLQAQVEDEGLPIQYSTDKESMFGISDYFGVSWSDGTKKIELLIKTPDDLADQGQDGGVLIPAFKYSEVDRVLSRGEIFEVFDHYLNTLGPTEVKVFMVSKKYDELLHAESFSGSKPSSLSDYR